MDFSAYDRRVDVRAAAVLTNSYVATTGQLTQPWHNQLIVYMPLTLGSLGSVEMKVEFSPDDSTWYQETESALSAGTSTDTVIEHTYAADGNYRIPIAIQDRYIRVSFKGTGTVTSSSAAADFVLGTS